MWVWSLAAVALLGANDGGYDYGRQDAQYDLQLVCYGEGTKPVTETHSGYQWNDDTHKYDYSTRVESNTAHVNTAVTVSLHDGSGRVHLPKQLIPPLHSGDDEGWWNLDKLSVGHDDIRATFRVNALNKPTLHIDRRSGMITIDGGFQFEGRCEADEGHRRF